MGNCEKCNRHKILHPVKLRSDETLMLCADCEWEAANLGADNQ